MPSLYNMSQSFMRYSAITHLLLEPYILKCHSQFPMLDGSRRIPLTSFSKPETEIAVTLNLMCVYSVYVLQYSLSFQPSLFLIFLNVEIYSFLLCFLFFIFKYFIKCIVYEINSNQSRMDIISFLLYIQAKTHVRVDDIKRYMYIFR